MILWRQRYFYYGGIALFVFGMLFSLSPAGVLAHSISSEEGAVIHITDEGFNPKEVLIQHGDTVIFENTGEDSHWPATNIHPTHGIYPDSHIEKCATDEAEHIFDACQGVPSGESYTFVFEHEGIWRFHDHLNPQHTGKITVGSGPHISAGGAQTKEGKGFFQRLWESISRFFASLFRFEGDHADVPAAPPRDYDDSIAEDVTSIFRDYDALYSYVKKYGPHKTVKHLHELQASYGDCHQTAHEAGRFAYELFNEKAFQTCSAECHSGCYHGATEAFFRDHGTVNLADDLQVICSSELNPFFSHQCIHGIGHGLMAWSDYEIFEALENCDLLPERRDSCYSGVFMENIVGGLAPEVGHFTEYLNDDPHFPCSILDEKYAGPCYFYQTSRMVQLFGSDFKKVASICSEIAVSYQTSCFLSMGRDVGGVYRGNPEGAIAACSNAEKGDPRIWCLGGAVQDSFWEQTGQNAALRFCELLEDTKEKDACYNTIFVRAPQVFESYGEHEQFCANAESEYHSRCIEFLPETS